MHLIYREKHRHNLNYNLLLTLQYLKKKLTFQMSVHWILLITLDTKEKITTIILFCSESFFVCNGLLSLSVFQLNYPICLANFPSTTVTHLYMVPSKSDLFSFLYYSQIYSSMLYNGNSVFQLTTLAYTRVKFLPMITCRSLIAVDKGNSIWRVYCNFIWAIAEKRHRRF